MTSGKETQQLITVEEALAILDIMLQQQRLNDIQELVFRKVLAGETYPKIAEIAGYDAEYIKVVGCQLWRVLSRAFGERVTKSNVLSVLRRHSQQALAVATVPNLEDEGASSKQPQDWGDAIDVSTFYGRTKELAKLVQWLVQDRCRLVAVLGMGGIGKTALVAKLAKQIQDEFDYLIWRSLRNAPPVQDLLAELIQFFSQQQETNVPETVDGKILRLMEYLRSSRCLVVLDNAETILEPRDRIGPYREGYERYGQLLRCVAETPHHSCLVLTSREKPKSLAAKEGETLPVRSLKLIGLPSSAGRKIFKARGSFWASEDEWKFLIEYYGGNPLALEMVAPVIKNLFNSSIYRFLDFLKQGTFVFDDIRNLLDQQFNRLSDLEKEVMYWLAINREPVSFPELQADFVCNVYENEIIEALVSLQRRSLIENSMSGFTQKPVVMDYMTERLIKQVREEIITERLRLLVSHSLVKAQPKDYIRASQIRIILETLSTQLSSGLENKKNIEHKLNRILSKLPE